VKGPLHWPLPNVSQINIVSSEKLSNLLTFIKIIIPKQKKLYIFGYFAYLASSTRFASEF